MKKCAYSLLLSSVLLAQTALAAPRPAFPPLPFAEFDQTRQQIMTGVACKWLSTESHWTERQQYDLLCTGGNWGTVTLMVDRAAPGSSQVGRVRLLWRDWDPKVHPAGGEAQVAGQFLNFVLNYFVPQKFAAAVGQAFWQPAAQHWQGAVADVHYNTEPGNGYTVHRLEIMGRPGAMMPGMQPPAPPEPMPPVPAQPQPPAPVMPHPPMTMPEQPPVRQPVPVVQAPQPAPVPMREVPEMQATIRVLSDKVEINGLSYGEAALNGVRLVPVLPGEDVLRPQQSELRVTPPPVGTAEYRQAEELTESYTQKVEAEGAKLLEVTEGLILQPEQVAPLLQEPDEDVVPAPEEEKENLAVSVKTETIEAAEKATPEERLPAQPYAPAIPPAQPLEEEAPKKQKKYENTDQAL